MSKFKINNPKNFKETDIEIERSNDLQILEKIKEEINDPYNAPFTFGGNRLIKIDRAISIINKYT